MPMLHWNSHLSVEHPEMDAEHQRLVELVNELYEAYCAKCSQTELHDILNRLAVCTSGHFQNEEQLMRRSQYPHSEKHMAEHAKLMQQLQDYQADLAQGREQLSARTLLYLKQWLLHHLLDGDQRLDEYLQQEAAATPAVTTAPAG